MNENYDNQQLFSEVDVPMNKDNLESSHNSTVFLNSKDVDKLERKAKMYEKLDKHIYKERGFHLLIGCVSAYLLLVILDMIVTNAFSWQTSALSESFIELLKFIISTLIGFVFSETKNKNE